ncbi:hypothetical protein CNMCM8980_005920 [Aspergillus fumigatiaffinis]|uniref:Meiotically up-regulated protein Msb1/Mug8 domain-containing protein n=1 Tax=Aspergillus fumigatiaffinis TaxID=340414 RepID=A0A8H4M3C7_9EURO|nr:hypothetical protein CNMCM5878_010058 [Aspergillus fumigatiaffinis]KAF4227679.1 hypothetical protein CNMCM6457_007308 [Aspergillus fumigatiaffinis]KAF4242562.1 hypothetical protein CNMCM6805_002634 [Aspergillus fumigatiaffinis]KAF4248367.1 hypothetical protein CNMCM8980_005920 [Aspergillus fumigatiaffinis]
MPFFARVFRSKDSNAAKKSTKNPVVENTGPAKPTWTDAWQRTEVAPEEVQELLRGCTQELKARALQTPFLLLPFRPTTESSDARYFIRNYFNKSVEKGAPWSGDALSQELRLTDPTVLCSVLKWCWSRLPGGVVTWDAYELFKVGEQDSQLARDAFSTFIPISVDSDARTKIIFDFFDLLAAVAAHGKSNGLGGRKLSRYAGWWAFEHSDTGNGFEAAYKNWAAAADATSHLFFAYLRSISPDSPRGISGISTLPIALQSLVQATEYPPETPTLLQVSTTKVVMIVDTVSPTPFALLRRAKNFEYRDSDRHLQEFASFDDPVKALTDECLRVLKCISSTNQSSTSDPTTSVPEASWSRFEDLGFGAADLDNDADATSLARNEFAGGLRSAPHSVAGDLGRPTTPSWADFMSSGFNDGNGLKPQVAPLLLPPDKVLPPIATVRGQSSQSHKRTLDSELPVEPAELASITTLDLDDSFWWVWISSLAVEEPASRKAVFGRCALIETIIKDTKWLVLEEQVKGAAPEPEPGAYIVEKKRFFTFSTRKGKIGRRKSSAKKVSAVEESYKRANNLAPHSKTSIAPDQHARIQAAAAALQKKHREQEQEAVNRSKASVPNNSRYSKANSIMSLQPGIMSEASQAMKWASNYDKNAYRAAYLKDSRAGTGTLAEENGAAMGDKMPEPPASPALSSSTRQAPPPVPKDSVPSSPTPVEHQQRGSVDENAVSRQDSISATTESLPKQSTDTTDDSRARLKKKPGNTGFKGMFGTKKKDVESKPPMKPTGAQPSAVAAARAALEGKAKESQETVRPNGASTLRKPVPAPAAAPSAAPAKVASPPADVEKPVPESQTVTADEQHDGPPKTRRDAEYDALSRVDTNERTAADREFSRFDQGPLMEQPAFAPEDSPVSETFHDKSAPAAAVDETPGRTEVSERATSPTAAPASSSYDRWAQIRKNAAERAAKLEQSGSYRYSQDEGNTSEEESFESRAARIKARVAELTGNMQAAS